MRPLLETLVRVAPNAKITTRTSASAVQAIACWDLRNIRRLVLEPVNGAFIEYVPTASTSPTPLPRLHRSGSLAHNVSWLTFVVSRRLLKEFPSVNLLDSYHIYDDRPDTSEDGRHWERVNADPEWSKPEEGALTYAMSDIILESWRLEKEREMFGI